MRLPLRLPQGWFTRANAVEYRWLANHLRDGDTLVEVGCWLGRSLCSLAPVIHEKRLKVIAVDVFTKTMAKGKTPLPRPQMEMFLANTRRFGLNPQCYAMPSLEAASLVPGKVGMVFLDGDHTYEMVKADIEAWRPKVTRILAGHDYGGPARNDYGVKMAVDEAFPRKRVRGNIWAVRVA